MTDPTLIFLREQIFWIEQLLEDCTAHIQSLDQATPSGTRDGRMAQLQRLQARAQALLDAFTDTANSVSCVN